MLSTWDWSRLGLLLFQCVYLELTPEFYAHLPSLIKESTFHLSAHLQEWLLHTELQLLAVWHIAPAALLLIGAATVALSAPSPHTHIIHWVL